MPAHTTESLLQTAYTEVLKKQDKYERRIQLALKQALTNIQGEMKSMYDKWAVDGKLTYAETAKYNRYASMETNIMDILDPVLKENVKDIKRLLPEQYNEAFYRTAWAIDNASGLRLNWGPINKNMILELFSIDTLKNKEMAEALRNYPIDARKKIRQALMNGMTIGKSFADMSRDLKKVINVTSYKALMIARTEGITAINHGTNDGYIKAQKEGIEGQIVWSATKDGRTRDTHGAMDGKIQQEDGLFDGPGRERAPFPGWEGLSAEERIHCRCNEQFQIDGYSPQLMRSKEGGIVPYQNYEDWKAKKPIDFVPYTLEADQKTERILFKDDQSALAQVVRQFFKDNQLDPTFLNNNCYGFEDVYKDIVKNPPAITRDFSKTTHYSTGTNTINMGPIANSEDGATTFLHEIGHFLDHQLNAGGNDYFVSYSEEFQDAIFSDTAQLLDDLVQQKIKGIHYPTGIGHLYFSSSPSDVDPYNINCDIIAGMKDQYDDLYEKHFMKNANDPDAIKAAKKKYMQYLMNKNFINGWEIYGPIHVDSYWKKSKYFQNTEIFAEMFETSHVVKGSYAKYWEQMQEFLPKTTTIYKRSYLK